VANSAPARIVAENRCLNITLLTSVARNAMPENQVRRPGPTNRFARVPPGLLCDLITRYGLDEKLFAFTAGLYRELHPQVGAERYRPMRRDLSRFAEGAVTALCRTGSPNLSIHYGLAVLPVNQPGTALASPWT